MTATHEIGEMREQAIKAARYFERGLREHGREFMALRSGDTVVVIASGTAGVMLANLVNTERIGKIVNGVEDVGSSPSSEPSSAADEMREHRADVVLIPLYHAPPPEHNDKPGKVHLHVLNMEGATLGRRVRQSGECLCSKKHGSDEQTIQGQTDMCSECVKVAADNGIRWSLG